MSRTRPEYLDAHPPESVGDLRFREEPDEEEEDEEEKKDEGDSEDGDDDENGGYSV